MLHKFNISPFSYLTKITKLWVYYQSFWHTVNLLFICKYVYDCFEFFVAFATSVNQYNFDKIIITNSSKSHNPVLTMHFIQTLSIISYASNFCLLCWHYAQYFRHPIMLRDKSILLFCFHPFFFLAIIFLTYILRPSIILSIISLWKHQA